MIKLRNVSKKYTLGGEIFTALDDISLEIKSGEYVSILGPSGSGKSTLMHLIGLLDQPTSGEIFIENKIIAGLSDTEISTLRNEFVGFVFQQFNLIPKLSVLENILLPTIYNRNKKVSSSIQKAMELINRFELKGKEKSYPNQISGGQQQRVAIARALINSPKLILADEPTGNLDSKTGQIILRLLEKLNKEDRITIAIVTHDPAIASHTKRKIVIKDGKLSHS